MEGFIGSFKFKGKEARSLPEVVRWTAAFAEPGLEGEGVSSWADDTLAIAWRLNPQIGDLHIARVNGYLICLIGQAAFNGQLFPGPSCSDDSYLEPLVHKVLLTEQGDPNFDALSQLNGTFLLLLYDSARGRLYIISDCLSSRFLFYTHNHRRLLFATDIRALLADPDTPRDLNKASVAEFLQFGMIFEDRTLYENIYMLPRASLLIADQEGIRIQEYWRLVYNESSNESEEYYAEALAHAFLEATERLLPSSSGLGLMLSGGLDSRMIAACLKALGNEAITITFADFENEEVRLARRVAQVLGFQHVFIKRHPEYYHDVMMPAVCLSNGLYAFYHAHMLGLQEQVRSWGICTLINGWGLDLLFSGSYMPKQTLRFLGRRFPLLRLQPLQTRAEIVSVLFDELRSPIEGEVALLASSEMTTLWQDWPQQVLFHLAELAEDRAQDPYNRLEFILVKDFVKFRSYLYPLSVRPYARERCLLFDNDLLSVYLSMPSYLRFNSRVYRKALGILNPELLKIPYAQNGAPLSYPEPLEQVFYLFTPFIRTRKLQLERLFGRYKEYPASTYVSSYPSRDPLVKQVLDDTIRKVLLRGKYLELGLLEPQRIARLVNLHAQGRARYGDILLNLITFALWMEYQ